MQGVQTGLSSPSGHGQLQSGIPVASLREPHAASLCVYLGFDLLVVAISSSHARHRELLHPNSGTQRLNETDSRLLTKAKDSAIRSRDIQAMVHAATFKRSRQTGSDTLAGYF